MRKVRRKHSLETTLGPVEETRIDEREDDYGVATPLSVDEEFVRLLKDNEIFARNKEQIMMSYRMRKKGANPNKNPDVGTGAKEIIDDDIE